MFCVKVCRRKSPNFNADKSKGIISGGEEGLECDIHVNLTRLEQVLIQIFGVCFCVSSTCVLNQGCGVG